MLHVDDNLDLATLAADFLERERERLSVDAVAKPTAGLQKLGETAYDCIISDYEMPGQNGIEFLKAVREEYPALPFILFTGKGSEEIASEAISAGVSDYLQKETGTEQYEILANRIVNNVERTRAQRQLEEQNSHFRQAQSMAHLGSWEKDIHADEIYWSDAVFDIFGLDADVTSIDHDQFMEFVHPADKAHVEGEWRAALTGDEYDVEHRIVTADGETRWVRERAEIAFDKTGAPAKALGVVQDITERKEQADRLQKTSARLRALFERSPDMINLHDIGGQIIKPNPQLCERTGYSEAELTDMAVWDLDTELEPDEATSLWKQMRPGESKRVDSTYRCRDGSTFPVEINIRRLDQGHTEHFVVISRDVEQLGADHPE